ncbi:TIGR00730 family Rossman fold protein [Leeia sp. TBRC 13508]|uniref:Cytokinin riboside 5'-monophosphate phosphoribohydrolase n=1 Tax=Leeia speluncae TaxID=2884804 RepID=A0ABS8D2J2_9NEIS|nr:TIGR00730 family Rossman fold protein [Leeia speluncae]MCB6182414.1 TIGR00730 family Rossman fold protein [Leeia speluncae]
MRIAVYCGSHGGNNSIYLEAARKVGHFLATSSIEIVYGGGKVGMMGAVADAALAAGGTVCGIIPVALQEKELAHQGISQLEVVKDMHERKARMAELSDAFIALPGAAGTLEEFFEAWTWAQLGYHQKPCGLLNVAGFFDPQLSMIDRIVEEGFMKASHRDMVIVSDEIEDMVRKIKAYQPPAPKWVTG